jgi:hypothetical protein
MDYPADGTPFELDSETVDLLYRAVDNAFLAEAEKRAAVRAVDYISAATLLIEPEEDDEPAVTVNGETYYTVPSTGEVICPECGMTRSTERISGHMASEHDDDPDDDGWSDGDFPDQGGEAAVSHDTVKEQTGEDR